MGWYGSGRRICLTEQRPGRVWEVPGRGWQLRETILSPLGSCSGGL